VWNPWGNVWNPWGNVWNPWGDLWNGTIPPGIHLECGGRVNYCKILWMNEVNCHRYRLGSYVNYQVYIKRKANF